MDHFYSPSGGTEGQIYNIIKRLDRNIYEPYLCIYDNVSDYFKKNTFPCPVYQLNVKSFYNIKTYYKFYQVRKIIKKNKINIVQTIFNDAALSIPFITLGMKVKIISTRRDMGFWYTPMRLMILRLNSYLIDNYLVNSNAVKMNVILKESVPEEKICVIHNGHNLSKFNISPTKTFYKNFSIPECSKIIGIVSNMRTVKRVDDLIYAFHYILERNYDCYLVIIGHNGELLEKYTNIIKKYNIENKVRFLGMIENPIPIIKNFTVAVNCSESEGLSNVIIEYMGCGVPVVATDTSGNKEIIRSNENGLLIPVGNIEALANAIITLLTNKNIRDKLIKNAYETVKDNFDENNINNQYQSYYRNVIRG